MSLLAVEIDDQLLMEFRKFAVAKHGQIYGVLKPEVELALKCYLEDSKKRTQENQTPELLVSSKVAEDREAGK